MTSRFQTYCCHLTLKGKYLKYVLGKYTSHLTFR
jgi:hypothetical protein